MIVTYYIFINHYSIIEGTKKDNRNILTEKYYKSFYLQTLNINKWKQKEIIYERRKF